MELFDIVNDMIANNEASRSYDPLFEVTSSLPGKGKIVGGTGEFKNAKGTFTEHESVHFLALPPEGGTLDSDVTLTLHFDRHHQHYDALRDEF